MTEMPLFSIWRRDVSSSMTVNLGSFSTTPIYVDDIVPFSVLMRSTKTVEDRNSTFGTRTMEKRNFTHR